MSKSKYVGNNKESSSPLDSLAMSSKKSVTMGKSNENRNLLDDYQRLETMYTIQNKTVRHCMHNVMSPLSAISGYFDLMVSSLDEDVKTKKIKSYIEKINTGLYEVGFLLGQLQEMHRVNQEEKGVEESPATNMNWLIDEVITAINKTTTLRADRVCLKSLNKPVYIRAELFQLKLILYNLIKGADSFCTDESVITLSLSEINGSVNIAIACTDTVLTQEKVSEIFGDKEKLTGVELAGKEDQMLSEFKISSDLASQIGGTIIIESSDNGLPLFRFMAPSTDVDLINYQ